MCVLATRRVWFLGVMEISDQDAWRWLFIKVNSREDLISKQPLWNSGVPDAYQSLLFAKVWYSIWCAQLTVLGSLPSIFPIWSSLNILSFSEVKWWINTAVNWDQFRDCCLLCRSCRFSAALAWSPCGTSCPLPPGFVSFVVSDTVSRAGTRRSLFPMWLLSRMQTVTSSTFVLCAVLRQL